MAEKKGNNKRRLSINLSLFALNDQNSGPSTKSPRSFEEPNGVVGLGIVAAMNENAHQLDAVLKKNCGRAAILALSPKSSLSKPIPIINCTNDNRFNVIKNNNDSGRKPSSVEAIEMCEEYTCVISHVGNNLIKKMEYFGGDFLGNSHLFDGSHDQKTTVHNVIKNGDYWVTSGMVSASSSTVANLEDETAAFKTADFLKSCFLCKKQLHGLDIFMYRGEKAFCSVECRCKQIAVDERTEKCGSGAMKPLDYSVSPCSGPMQVFSGVAAA